jgi:hypothetical protein
MAPSRSQVKRIERAAGYTDLQEAIATRGHLCMVAAGAPSHGLPLPLTAGLVLAVE